jgi:hypothetical protein
VVRTLLSPEFFSGWGVRTVAASQVRYNPMGYHTGCVWPHDNALITQSLARYGQDSKAVRLLNGLFGASLYFDLHRMPELFCGFAQEPGEGPVPYPVACAPQAWSVSAGPVCRPRWASCGFTTWKWRGRSSTCNSSAMSTTWASRCCAAKATFASPW